MKTSIAIPHAVQVAMLTALVSGCAANVRMEASALPHYVHDYSAKRIQIIESLEVESTAGYKRIIGDGSCWEYIGSIKNGSVYESCDGIFTIEGSNLHEAYIVLRNEILTGFYLPVERAFSPVNTPQTLNYAIIDNQRREK